MNLGVKALALFFLAAPALLSCMVDDRSYEFMESVQDGVIANYQVAGVVSDAAGVPVAGIRVVADHSSGPHYLADTLYTDKEGRFSKFLSAPKVERFVLRFSDIDGIGNGGKFDAKSVEVIPLLTEVANGYFGGSYLVSADVRLDRK